MCVCVCVQGVRTRVVHVYHGSTRVRTPVQVVFEMMLYLYTCTIGTMIHVYHTGTIWYGMGDTTGMSGIFNTYYHGTIK